MGERAAAATVMQAIVQRRAFGDRREWSRELAAATAAGLFLGLIGPFGSYLNASRLVVLAYWLGTVLFGAVLFGLTLRPVMRLLPRRGPGSVAIAAAALLLAAAAMSLAGHAVAMRLWPGPIGGIGSAAWYGQTMLISTPPALCYWLSGRREAPASSRRTVFLDRLPPQLGRTLIALQMEDHYVRAHTARGSALVLIPLHQAVDELAGLRGRRTHRSWWVADEAVAATVQDGRNLRLRLVNGLEAPVSRRHVADVREAGLLQGQGSAH